MTDSAPRAGCGHLGGIGPGVGDRSAMRPTAGSTVVSEQGRGVAGGSTARAWEESRRAPGLAATGRPATPAGDPDSECSRARVPRQRAGRGGSGVRHARRTVVARAARRGRGDDDVAAGSSTTVPSRPLPRGAGPDPVFPHAHEFASSMSSGTCEAQFFGTGSRLPTPRRRPIDELRARPRSSTARASRSGVPRA
jgi:hypothetical protein